MFPFPAVTRSFQPTTATTIVIVTCPAPRNTRGLGGIMNAIGQISMDGTLVELIAHTPMELTGSLFEGITIH